MKTWYQKKFEAKRPGAKALNLPGDLHSTPYALPKALVSDWEDKIDPQGEGEGLRVELLLLAIKGEPTEVAEVSD